MNILFTSNYKTLKCFITWLTTSKNNAAVVCGVKVQNFHCDVPPNPMSVSDTQGLFTLRDTHGPIAPITLTQIKKKHYGLFYL